MNDGSQLESRLVLDAASIPAEVAAAMAAKTQLKDDLANWKLDYIIFQNDNILYKLDKSSLAAEVTTLRGKVKEFNDTYKVKTNLKLAYSTDQALKDAPPTLSLEFDLTGLKGAILNTATADKAALQSDADRIGLESSAMKLRAKELATRAQALKDRKALLDKENNDLQGKEELAVMDEMMSGVAVTDFSDPDLNSLEADADTIAGELDYSLQELNHDYGQILDPFDDEYDGDPNYWG